MQHTPKYKLNLIDPSDDFSPDPLNANATALETQLAAHETRLDGMDTKFTAAIGSGGSTARIAAGSYKGNGTSRSLSFPFKPLVVFVGSSQGSPYAFPTVLLRGVKKGFAENDQTSFSVTWSDKGVSWSSVFNNVDGTTYYYVAIGE